MRRDVAGSRAATSSFLINMRNAAVGALSFLAVVSLRARAARATNRRAAGAAQYGRAGSLAKQGDALRLASQPPWRRASSCQCSDGTTARTDTHIGEFDQIWCGVAGDTGETPRTGGVRRRAYFYVPARVAGAPLPAIGGRSADDCVLGALEFMLPPATLTNLVETFASDSAQLAARIGPIAGHGMIDWRFYDRRREGTWHLGDMAIGLVETASDSGRRFTLQLVITGAGFPGDIDFDRDMNRRFPSPRPDQIRQRRHGAELDTVLAWSGLAAGTKASLLGFADRFARDTGYGHLGPIETDHLAALLALVVGPQRSVNPEQRSARLVAADMILEAGARDIGFGEDTDSSARARFVAIGETFGDDPVDKGYSLTHGWLQQAVTLNSPGPAGDHAFLLALQRAFDFTAGCGSGSDLFREVIKRGEGYLAAHPRSAIRGEVEFFVAEGYSDIIALASGAAYDGLGIEEYRADSVGARAAAIRHFREGYRLAGGSAHAAADWPDAWQVTAGLPPEKPHFYCIDD